MWNFSTLLRWMDGCLLAACLPHMCCTLHQHLHLLLLLLLLLFFPLKSIKINKKSIYNTNDALMRRVKNEKCMGNFYMYGVECPCGCFHVFIAIECALSDAACDLNRHAHCPWGGFSPSACIWTLFASVLIAHQSKAKAREKAAGAQQEICIGDTHTHTHTINPPNAKAL